MKRSYLTFLLCIGLAAPLRASPPIGLAVQTWHYDPATKQVTVRLANTSGKDITAFNLSVTETYIDGTTNSSQKMTDYLPLMASAEVSRAEGTPRADNGTFLANTSIDLTFAAAKDVSNVSIIPDMVAYADHTADVDNRQAFEGLIADRKEVLLATQQANQVMKAALSSPNPKGAAAKELTRLANVAKARRNGGGLTEMTLRGRMENLQLVSDLTLLIKEGEIRASVYSPHTQLTRGGQQ